MLGDLDLIHLARTERTSLDRSSTRSSMDVPQPERPSIDLSALRRNSVDSIDFSTSMRRASTSSAASWSFLGTSPASVGSAPGSYFPAALLARHESLQRTLSGPPTTQEPEKLERIPKLIRTLSKGLDPFR